MRSEEEKVALSSISFDSQAFDVRSRFDSWREHIAPFFDVTTQAAEGEDPVLNCSQKIVHLGEALVGYTKAASQLFTRDANRINRQGFDHFMVQVFLEGGGAMASRIVQQGDILVIDMGRPHLMLNYDFAHISVVVPRHLDRQLTAILENLHRCVLPREDPRIRLLGNHLSSMWAALPDMTAQHAPAVTQGFCSLMRHLLVDPVQRPEEATPGLATAIKQSIESYLGEHLARQVTVAELTAQFRISRATLYRLFAPEGGVQAYLRELRLLKAYRDLTGPSRDRLSIGEIGWRTGFASDTQFSRAFRNRFGLSPTQARIEARARQNAFIDDNNVSFWLSGLEGGS